MRYKFNISRLLDIPELKKHIEILDEAEVKKYFNWLMKNFKFPYGQIDWTKVPNSNTVSIDCMLNEDLSDILSIIVDPDSLFTGVWSDIEQGIKLKGEMVIKYPSLLWYPVKENFWLISDDYKTVIEFHHESYLSYTTTFA